MTPFAMSSDAVARARHAAIYTLQPMQTAQGAVRSRINVENQRQLADAGFHPGRRYRVRYAPGQVEVVADPQGDRVVAPKHVPRRDGTAAIGSRLDVRSFQVAAHLPGQDRVLALYLEGRILFLRIPTAARGLARIAQLAASLDRGTLRTVALYAGVASLDLALHDGMQTAGLSTSLAFLNDAWGRAVDAAVENNPVTATARTFTGGIEEVLAADVLPTLGPIDLVALGIPCTGASRGNTATRDNPESHTSAGHQVLNAVMALQQLGFPPLILVENVLAWATTQSCELLRRVLHEQGYDTALIGDTAADGSYRGLNSADFGTIEARTRMALLAYPRGLVLTQGDTFRLEKTGRSTQTVGAIRLPEAAVPDAEYDKGQRLFREDRLARGWTPNVVDDAATVTPCLTATCWKQRSEDPRLRHPEDPQRTRLPMPEEHARLKGQPESLIATVVENSVAHTLLGNGVARNCWMAVGAAIAGWLWAMRPLMGQLVAAAQQVAPLAGVESLSLFDVA